MQHVETSELKSQRTVKDKSGSCCMHLAPNNSKSSVTMKIYTTYHGSTGVPSTLGAVNPASITELILVDGHDAAAMHPLFDQNTNAHEPITQQVKEALTATERHDQHARARTVPQDSQFLQPPSSEWNVSQYIPCSNCELATQNREPRAAVSHTCMHASPTMWASFNLQQSDGSSELRWAYLHCKALRSVFFTFDLLVNW